MPRHLPPLNWVRAFEAAARHQSFLRAANELGVSAGAVSQHVKLLEARLEVTLFERHARGVLLTQLGASYLDSLGPALDAIARATRLISNSEDRASLRLAALPAVAEKWLTPRLSSFQQQSPACAVQIVTAETVTKALLQESDVVIHYEQQLGDEFSAMPLFRDEIFPVCCPAMVQNRQLRTPEDLSNCRLLYDTKWRRDWAAWNQAAKQPHRDLARELGFSLYSMAVAAAVQGQGVLIGHRQLVARELADGELIAPFHLTLPAPHQYMAMYRTSDSSHPHLAAFLNWLRTHTRLAVMQ